jgi:hypothetical protein
MIGLPMIIYDNNIYDIISMIETLWRRSPLPPTRLYAIVGSPWHYRILTSFLIVADRLKVI